MGETRALAILALGLSLAAAPTASEPIPAERLFPSAQADRNHVLSHDGSRMLVTRVWPRGWAVDVIDTDTGRAHGLLPRRFLYASWGESDDIVYATDGAGLLYRVPLDRIDGAERVDLAPLESWRTVLWPTPEHPFLMVADLGERNRLYRCDPRPQIHGPAKCEAVADGAPSLGSRIEWLLTADGRAMARIRIVQSGRSVFEAPDAEGSWRQVFVFASGSFFVPLGRARPDGTLLALSDRGRDRIALVALDIRSGAETVIHRDERFDVLSAIVSPGTGKPLVAFTDPGYQEIHYFDDRARRTFAALHRKTGTPSHVTLIGGDRTGRYLTVRVTDERAVRSEYLLDLRAGSASRLSVSALAPLADRFAPTEPVAFAARDGRRIYGYLTRPRGVDKPTPMLIMLHGGPWSRYYWTFDPTTQFFVSRGYSVLKLNYRGSTGYNRAYLEAVRGKAFGAVFNDIVDAVEWAYRLGRAEPGRVALYGESFGGFLVLAALARHPRLFGAGIAANPVTDAVAFWTKEWRSPVGRAQWGHWFGSRELPRKALAGASPLGNHGSIAAPVLLFVGLRDGRVPPEHSHRLHRRLRKAGRPSHLIAFERGRHDLWALPAPTLIKMHGSMLTFLQHHMR